MIDRQTAPRPSPLATDRSPALPCTAARAPWISNLREERPSSCDNSCRRSATRSIPRMWLPRRKTTSVSRESPMCSIGEGVEHLASVTVLSRLTTADRVPRTSSDPRLRYRTRGQYTSSPLGTTFGLEATRPKLAFCQ